jgi:hypothetical protein
LVGWLVSQLETPSICESVDQSVSFFISFLS